MRGHFLQIFTLVILMFLMSLTLSQSQEPSSTNQDCIRCAATAEYNPVCGTNGVTYGNPGVLRCAKQCDSSIEIRFYGRCEPI